MGEPWAAGRGAEALDVCTPSSLRKHPDTAEPHSTGKSPVIWKRSLENSVFAAALPQSFVKSCSHVRKGTATVTSVALALSKSMFAFAHAYYFT